MHSRKRSFSAFLVPFGTGAVLAFLPLLIQFFHLRDPGAVYKWISIFTESYLVNTVITAAIFLLFYLVFNSIYFSLTAEIILLVTFGIANMQKMRILQQPLLPGDLFFFKQALLVMRYYIPEVTFSLILMGAMLSPVLIFRKRINHYPLPFTPRIVTAAVIAIPAFFIGCNFHAITEATNRRMSIINEFWDQRSNYRKNGVLYGFLLGSGSLTFARPDNYSKKAIDTIFTAYGKTEPEPCDHDIEADSTSPSEQPDVIIYMNESFWDITQFDHIHPPHDPIPVFHELMHRGPTTRLISPVFGGNTCNAEFEILTGMPCSYFPAGTYAYNQYIHRPVPSLVRVFKQNGYLTVGIHSFKKWFWNRINVYRHLGFDTFLSVESMNNPEKKGKFVSDLELARHIIRQANSAKRPQFIFALSMQNHGPYNEKRYTSFDCPLTCTLSSAARRELNNFTQGLVDADRSLLAVKKYIDTTPRPTLLLFFGDHLPGFSHVYDEAGCTERIQHASLWAHTTTAVWYANFRLKPLPHDTVSMVYIPFLVSGQAGISTPVYYRFLGDLCSRHPVFTETEYAAVSGKAIVPSDRGVKKDRACRLIIYDALFGRQYGARYHQVTEKRSHPFTASLR